MALPTSRIQQLKELLAFVAELALQFWPPYRFEHDEESTSRLVPIRQTEPRRPAARR